MEGYLHEQFWHHPAINSRFMRFLTQAMTDQSALGLKGKIDSISKKVASMDGFATRAALDRLGTKVENVIKANSLKQTGAQGLASAPTSHMSGTQHQTLRSPSDVGTPSPIHK
jgi:hypothetical protein